MMTILLILSVLLVVSFTGITIWRTGELPESISAMAYALPDRGGLRWLWTLWMWAVALTLAPSMTDALDGSVWQFVGFLMIASLLFVGAWPLFSEDTKGGHYFLAYAAGILSQLCVILINPWWILAWLPMVMLIMGAFASFNDSKELPKILDGKGVFLAECICYITLVGSLFTV